LNAIVIEGGEEVGGLCILRGCMPTKALLYAAEVMHLASHPEPFGIRAEDVSFNFAQVMARQECANKRIRRLPAGAASWRQIQVPARDGPFLRMSTHWS